MNLCFADMESKVQIRTICTISCGANEIGKGSCGGVF